LNFYFVFGESYPSGTQKLHIHFLKISGVVVLFLESYLNPLDFLLVCGYVGLDFIDHPDPIYFLDDFGKVNGV
jgi:hypothetical protein